METHYYKVKQAKQQNHTFYTLNRLFSDYVKYLVDREGEGDESKPFLTDCLTDVSLKYIPFAFAWIDLPLNDKSSKQQHKFKSDNKRGIEVTAGTNCILFKKEIKEGEC